MTKIELNDSGIDAIKKMCEGNPGGLNVLMLLLKEAEKIDPSWFMGGMGYLLWLDELGIYGARIWMLFKDVCKQDLVKMCAVLRACQLGYISKTQLDHAIDNYGEGLELEELHDKVSKNIEAFSTEKTV